LRQDQSGCSRQFRRNHSSLSSARLKTAHKWRRIEVRKAFSSPFASAAVIAAAVAASWRSMRRKVAKRFPALVELGPRRFLHDGHPRARRG
jgi:hypothetical protein